MAIPAAPRVLSPMPSSECAPAAQSLYQRERFSTNSAGVTYEFDCPEGVYETTLLETETFWSATNKRQFNVFIREIKC